MSTPLAPTNSFKFKLFLLNWAVIFPGVMLLNAAAQWLLGSLQPPEWVLTGLVTGVLTLGLVYSIGPWLERTLRQWLRKS